MSKATRYMVKRVEEPRKLVHARITPPALRYPPLLISFHRRLAIENTSLVNKRYSARLPLARSVIKALARLQERVADDRRQWEAVSEERRQQCREQYWQSMAAMDRVRPDDRMRKCTGMAPPGWHIPA